MTNEMEDTLEKKLGTRVFKKSSPNNKITIYLGKRDFLDKNGNVDPIEGIVLLDPEYIKDKKVFIHVLALFRYGRDDLDVLGLTFRKDLYLSTQQLYPTTNEISQPFSKLQERLITKLGNKAVPFTFQIPHMTPASVTLQPDPDDSGKPCGVDYELKVYVSDSSEGKTHKRNSVRLMIRKLTFASPDPGPQQFQEVVKEYKMCNGKIRLETSLDKEKYFHGESIAVNVSVDNASNRIIRKIRLQVVQLADIMLFTRAMYKCVVDEIESDDGFPISPGQTGWCRIFHMCPLLSNNRHKRGLALDGLLRYEDTNLASSTVLDNNTDQETMGIVVNYFIRVRIILGFGTSDIQLEIPFILTHPNPDVNFKLQNPVSHDSNTIDSNGIDTDFSNLEFNKEDELIFEDFARLRLCGNETNCEDA